MVAGETRPGHDAKAFLLWNAAARRRAAREVVRTSGKTIIRSSFTGKRQDCAPGTVFEITDAELAHADAYEVAAYVRVKAPLASGLEAWVYVDARGKPPGG
jgi:gamma-glutamyl AIG2-like cyclotransferase